MKRIAMLGGGSGNRDITMALCRSGHDVTRIVPAWDSGGSSRALRLAFGMVAIGDTRQALMTLAHGEGRVGQCCAQLAMSGERLLGNAHALGGEFVFFTDKHHDIMFVQQFFKGGHGPFADAMLPDNSNFHCGCVYY